MKYRCLGCGATVCPETEDLEGWQFLTRPSFRVFGWVCGERCYNRLRVRIRVGAAMTWRAWRT